MSFAARRPFALLFVCLALLYTLTGSGYIILSDGAAMTHVTEAILHGHLWISGGVPGNGGHTYSIYGVGWSLVDLPLLALGVASQHVLHLSNSYSPGFFASSFLNPLIVAGAAFLFAKLVFSIASSRPLTFWLTLVFALSTPAWAYTKDAFSEPLVMTCLLAGTYLFQVRPATRGPSIAAGCALGLALATRMDALPEAIVVLAYGLVRLSGHRRLGCYCVAPVILGGLVVLIYNAIRFGSMTATGYEHAGAGTEFHRSVLSFVEGVGLILASPDRGLLWYVPQVIVSVLALPRFARIAPREAGLCAALFVVATVEHANVFVGWDGGSSWGPRFLIPVLPFLLLPLIAVDGWRPAWRRLLALAAVAGCLVNLGPVVVAYERYYYALDGKLQPGIWPQVYLWRSSATVLGNVIRGEVPEGRVTALSDQGSAVIVRKATVMNAPHFWWFFLWQEGHAGRLVVVAVPPMVVALVATFATSAKVWLATPDAPDGSGGRKGSGPTECIAGDAYRREEIRLAERNE